MSYNANQERGQEQRHIAFLAIGTRGDVQPLAILAATLARRSSRVTFVTNASVRRFVQPQLNASGVRHIEFLTLPSMTPMGAEPTVSEEDHREECVRALETTFGKTGTECESLLVINLFALEGFHIAEALGIPCAIVSPCVVPYTAPSSVMKRLKRGMPGLCDSEVEHWAWPLFDTKRWGRWRRERLHLDEVPFLTRRRKTPLIYAISPTMCPVPGYWPESARMTGFFFPPADWEHRIPCTFSKEVTDFSSDKVVTITMSTPWDMGLLGGISEAVRFIETCRSSLASSGLRGLFVISAANSVLGKAWRRLFPVTNSTTRLQEWSPDDNTSEEMHGIVDLGGDQIIQAVAGSPPFEKLFSQSCGVWHHGGSGRVAEATRAGKPQIILPTLFDQRNWAERLAWLSVARIISRQDMSGADSEKNLADAFEFIQGSEVIERSRCLMVEVLKESDAVRVSAEILEREARVSSVQSELTLRASEAQVLTLQNGMNYMFSGNSSAETSFLYDELIIRRVYFRHGIAPVVGGNIVDVGANTGMFLLSAFEMLRGARWRNFVAVEPSEKNSILFRKNAAAQGIEKYDLIPCALGQRDGRATMTYFPAMPGNTTMKAAEKYALQKCSQDPSFFDDGETFDCRLMTLESALKECKSSISRIDLLKIDVEGSELNVLKGISKTLWGIVLQIVLEVHDVDGRLEKIERLLQSEGFKTITDLQDYRVRTYMLYGWR